MSPVRTLLKKSWGLYRSHFTDLIGYAAWILLPFLGVVLLQPIYDTAIGSILVLIFAVTEIFALIWVEILLLMFIDGVIRNRPRDHLTLQKESILKIQPMVIVALIQLLIILGGMILLIIPGLVFFVWYAFSQVAVVLDDKRRMGALEYSRKLVRGRFFRSAWNLIGGLTIIFIVYSAIMGFIVSGIAASVGIDPVALLSLPEDQVPLWLDIVEMIGITFIIPLELAYVTFLYENLKHTHPSQKLEKGCHIT